VGVVYQNPDYQLFMPTVQREIEFAAVSKEYAERMIDLFNLRLIRDRHPQSLSEGQKRRVSIAAVMAGKPELLLLDEPTVGQDYRGLCELVEILNTLHAETGNTMITVTHDKRCVSALCDKSVVIGGGKVLTLGSKSLAENYFN
jgi:energy-coupling factor transport system ATP-binding protein